MKRILATGAAAALMLASTVPAFASVNVGYGNGNISQSNMGGVINNVHVSATSGRIFNTALVAGVQGGISGTATSRATVDTALNGNTVSCAGCAGVNVGVANGNIGQSNVGFVYNGVSARARTGGITNVGGLVFAQGGTSGAANSAAVVSTNVNTNWVGPLPTVVSSNP